MAKYRNTSSRGGSGSVSDVIDKTTTSQEADAYEDLEASASAIPLSSVPCLCTEATDGRGEAL